MTPAPDCQAREAHVAGHELRPLTWRGQGMLPVQRARLSPGVCAESTMTECSKAEVTANANRNGSRRQRTRRREPDAKRTGGEPSRLASKVKERQDTLRVTPPEHHTFVEHQRRD